MNAVTPIASDEKTTPTRRVPKRIVHAIDLRLTGKVNTWKDAAIQSGVTPEWLSRSLQKVHVKAFLERRSRETIAGLLPQAVATMANLLESDSDHVRKDVAIHLLRLAGIEPASDGKSPLVNVNVVAGQVVGYQIDLTPKQPVIDITPPDNASGGQHG